MENYYYNPGNLDVNNEITKSNNYPNNLDYIQNEKNMNNLLDEHFRKYLVNKCPKSKYNLDVESSEEEINTKEDIIQTKNDDEIEHISTGRFKFTYNQLEQEDINKIEKEKELNNDKNNFTEQEDIKDINNKNNNIPNESSKITNNICIIINKQEVKENHIEKEEINKSISFEYLNTFGNEEEGNNENCNTNKIKIDENLNYQKSKKIKKRNNKRPLLVKLKHKKNNSYVENTNLKYNSILGENTLNNNYNYSYVQNESSDEEGKKYTLHRKLTQKQKKLKTLEKNIEQKTIEIKEKKNIIDKIEKKHNRSITFGNENCFFGNKLGVKEGFTNKDSDLSMTEKKNKKSMNNNYNMKNNYYNIGNKSINPENKYLNDISMNNAQNNKYIDLEKKFYSTISHDLNNDKLNISFNKSIEQKRKLLGIPLNQNEFQKINQKIYEEMNEEEEKVINQKLSIFKKRQDEILKIYEKKNLINQQSRENIKNFSKKKHNSYTSNNNGAKIKQKNPIRIIYNDNLSKSNFLNNNLEKESNINDYKNIIKLGNEIRYRNINYNNSYSGKNNFIKKNKNRISNSQENIYDYNKIKNNNNEKSQNNNHIKKKIKVFRNKEKLKDNKNLITKNNKKKSKEQNELKNTSRLNYQKEKKMYENKSYYSKYLSKLFGYNDKDSNQKNKKASTKNINNLNTNKRNTYINYNNNNLIIDNSKNSMVNINTNNNNNEITPTNKNKAIYSSKNSDEIMTIQDNEDVKTIHIIKKRNKSPQIIPKKLPVNESQTQNKIQNQNNEIKKKENIKEKKVEKKEYKSTNSGPGRGISALRRINQKIENYKKNIFIKKKKKPKAKNSQLKSSSQLKKKFGKQIFAKVKQNNSIRTLPNANENPFKNFDFIDDL